MKKILMMAVLIGVTGGAYAYDLNDAAAVNAKTLEALVPAKTLPEADKIELADPNLKACIEIYSADSTVSDVAAVCGEKTMNFDFTAKEFKSCYKKSGSRLSSPGAAADACIAKSEAAETVRNMKTCMKINSQYSGSFGSAASLCAIKTKEFDYYVNFKACLSMYAKEADAEGVCIRKMQ
ncbi:MAG: hypothetical protein WCW52_04955 [Elusimicrobiales bacterium]|jgi:hypothetical protein